MHWNFMLTITAAWTAAGTALYLLAPGAAPFLLPLSLVAPVLWRRWAAPLPSLWPPSWLSCVLAATALYLAINATWSSTPTRAYVATTIFLIALVSLYVIERSLPLAGRKPLRAMAIGFYVGYLSAGLLLSIEILFDHPIHLRLFAAFPDIAPHISNWIVKDGVIEGLPAFFLNRHMASLVFLSWPAIVIVHYLGTSVISRAVLMACLVPAVVAIVASQHETSKLAILGGAAAFVVLMLLPRFGRSALTAAWITACAAVVPLTAMTYDMGLQQAEWLPLSARHRIVIWRATAEKIVEAPILGHGMVTAREFGKRELEHPHYAPGTPFALSPGPHAHNVYLEVWFETGVLGVALLLAIGLLTLRAIYRLPQGLHPYFYAMFASNALLAASSTSLWSRWFLASFALSAIFGVLAWSFAVSTAAGEK